MLAESGDWVFNTPICSWGFPRDPIKRIFRVEFYIRPKYPLRV